VNYRAVCIMLRGQGRSRDGGAQHGETRARDHFDSLGVDVSFFYGLPAEQLGIVTTLPYEVDVPGSGFNVGQRITGCWLSHRALWAALFLHCTLDTSYELIDTFLILEEDAKFPPDWRVKIDQVLLDAPDDWDMLYVGSCCTKDKKKRLVKGSVWEVEGPLCLHGYFVRKRALLKLIDTQDGARCYAPIDVSVVMHTLKGGMLKAYTVLPRILEQWDTGIPE
jgi:hypothetical protein